MLFPGGDKTRTLKKPRGHDRQRAKLILRQVRSRLASQLRLSIVRSPTPNSMPTNRPPPLGLASAHRFVEYRENTLLLIPLFAQFPFLANVDSRKPSNLFFLSIPFFHQSAPFSSAISPRTHRFILHRCSNTAAAATHARGGGEEERQLLVNNC